MAAGQAGGARGGAPGQTDQAGTGAGTPPAGTAEPGATGQGTGGDLYVTGGTEWESYSLEALVAMVSDKASVPQLERLADDWRAAGNEVVDASDVLTSALDELMRYWSGAAAEQARRDVALNAQWVSDLGETAYRIGDPIQEAAGALKAAQDAMPQLPATPEVVPPAQAADSAALAERTGGSLAAAVSGVAAGSESAFAADQKSADLKAVAVEAMRRFEGAAMGIDAATPQFEQRSTTLHPRTPAGPETLVPTSPQTPTERWETLTGGGTGTSASAATAGRTSDRTPVPTATTGGYDGSGYSGGGAGFAGGGFGGGGAAPVDGPDAPYSRGPVGTPPGVGVNESLGGVRGGGAIGAPAAAGAGGAPHAGAGMGGMPMGGAMGGGPAGDQGEHRRRYPFGEEDSFLLTDKKASPPVIGA
ncbi:WXG100 family type VII secretion target [Actinokineospora bangkokensis]|uniref:PPE family domain-containing protein n=1 Tax=Actinokineospora bangkokensis TaxID=1193682 RepID=A0A1Q9LDN9_9PSEU|nr:PPE domain-containing protein [Actinokineospora bangkokensis]OLR90133.1 hypothetical protein BJP25_03935 [Actinokineospora bangkokensis]